MMKSPHLDDWHATDAVNLVAGVLLFLSPWVLGFATLAAAAWNAWIVGAAIALIAVAALLAFHKAEEWVNGALGLWAVVAPWALGFDGMRAATGTHVVLGLIVVILAAATLWSDTNRPHSTP
jgi:hypothetical protein